MSGDGSGAGGGALTAALPVPPEPDPAASDRYWLVMLPAGRRFRATRRDRSGAEWAADTRVTAYDLAAVAALVERARQEGFRTTLHSSRRGVPYAVLSRAWLVALTAEEPVTWGFAAVNLSYLRGVIVAKHAAPPAPPPPAPADDAPEAPELGAEFRKWEL